MTVITKNLGQVKALHIGATAPDNTDEIWRDTTTTPRIHKSYDDVSSTWKPMSLISGSYIPFESNNYISVFADGSTTDNGTKLKNAVVAAKLLTPNDAALSDTNRAVIYLFAGIYDLGSSVILLGNYVDIIGIGDPKDIIITSTSGVGTINISNSNNYSLYNLTIKNTDACESIAHNSGQTDNGRWVNLILYGSNTDGTNFSGYYNNIVSTEVGAGILNGSISGSVLNSTFLNDSCGNSSSAAVNITGVIYNCTGGSRCFGYSSAGNISISGTISNCVATGNSFGCTSGLFNVSISGIIDNCISTTLSFGYSSTGACTISGKILKCIGTTACFGSSSAPTGSVTISGIIDNCIGTSNCFGNGPTINTTGTIKNCTATSGSYGDTSATGKIINCTRTSGYGTHSGTFDRCTFSENSASVSALKVYAGAIIRRCNLYQAGAADTVTADGAISASIYHCSMNKAENVLITNNIGTPYNVVDTDISI